MSMNKGKVYKTRQREYILECIRKKADAYITIQQLSEELEKLDQKVGLTTIYRTLNKLEQENAIAKVSIDGEGGACYRYLPQEDNIFFSLKCEGCGRVVSIDCAELSHLYAHLSREHQIYIDPGKTMFYGVCAQCCANGIPKSNESEQGDCTL
jgi:Fur family ferric uptake transcriptional regulator